MDITALSPQIFIMLAKYVYCVLRPYIYQHDFYKYFQFMFLRLGTQNY